jgi:phosphoglycolate phosphatase
LLLDLDGTLVDTVPDLAPALNRLLRARGLAVCDHAQVAAMVGDGVAALVAKAFAEHGLPPDAAAIATFTADYQAHVADDSRLYPGVLAALTGLAGQGWRLAVCTNKPLAAARALLEVLGLAPLISAIGAGDSFAVRKPDPAHLLATLALVSGTADAAVMLGDHRNDVAASAAAGVACIFAGWGYGTPAMAAGSAAVAPDINAAVAIANRLLPAP